MITPRATKPRSIQTVAWMLLGFVALGACRPSLEQSLAHAQHRWQKATCIPVMPPIRIVWHAPADCGGKPSWGCWGPGYVWIDSTIDESDQDEVVMHEYGHELAQKPGEHVTGNATMASSINSSPRRVTPDDIMFVCENRHCRCNNPEK